MITAEIEQEVKGVHGAYLAALGTGNMEAVADHFSYPAVFKGFLNDIALANDNQTLADTYQRLIAAAPKAQRTELLSTQVDCLRPDVYSLTMIYDQFDANDKLLHSGRALYLMKSVSGVLKIFAVL